MLNKRKVKARVKETSLLKDYGDPAVSGSLGGVQRFARAQKLPLGKVRETLERDLGYTLYNDGIWYRRAVGGGSDRSDQYCQIQSRLQVSIDSGRHVFQVRLGGTYQN